MAAGNTNRSWILMIPVVPSNMGYPTIDSPIVQHPKILRG